MTCRHDQSATKSQGEARGSIYGQAAALIRSDRSGIRRSRGGGAYRISKSVALRSPSASLLELGARRVNRQRAGGTPPSLALDGDRGDGGSNWLPRAAEVAGGGFRGPWAGFRPPAARAL